MQKISQNNPTTKRGWLIFKNGELAILWDRNQGMGNSCTKASDKILPQQAIKRSHFDDQPADPPDLEYDRRQVQH